ncbi:hypothetical protein MegaChil _gp0226 [Megavirus chiliensis]|uniref:Uncharacterized protein mg226 n=1 Tax=Megavirus chiliensis TaxID=1094892 RepID=G5CRQ2_9VIRU|nr:hypothetical protein MegaChil _gp0226 [Megavirus chiliensis]
MHILDYLKDYDKMSFMTSKEYYDFRNHVNYTARKNLYETNNYTI